MDEREPYVFDGHNDLLSRLHDEETEAALASVETGRAGAVDLARARAGGFGGGFFACYVPSIEGPDLDETIRAMETSTYDIALPPAVPASEALPIVLRQVSMLTRLERRGVLTLCRTVAEIRDARARDRIAAILHLEGAEAIDPDLHALDVLHAAGLRSLGPVWSRPTIFGQGVPFRFPSGPDTGAGLTEAGERLVSHCDALGIMLDLSHLTEAGFWDVARLSSRPLVATHSNAHALCPHSRNLTDAQLDAIAASDGMVGLNFAVSFLREDGRKIADTPVADILRHLDHLIGRLGEDRVGLGSDYDGAVVPQAVDDVGKLPVLRRAMRDHGYDENLIAKLCHGNWLRVLEKSWA
jgi:membrane dipeptidase